MLAPRSAKALQEKFLSKLHGIRKLPRFVAYEFLEKFSIIRHSDQDIDKRFLVFIIAIEVDKSFRIVLLIILVNWWVLRFTTSCEYGIHMLIARLRWL
ncbi:hypothetical protein Tco_0094730, partial [Tanacetum coccineum]